jgi:hypothetical protein
MLECIWEEYGVRRSARRGATTEALNTGTDGATIVAINGWRKVDADIFDAAALHAGGAGYHSSTQVIFRDLREWPRGF